MARAIVPEAEEVLDRSYRVLDHGVVSLIDYMGSDQCVVDAARVSYQEGTKKKRNTAGLIDYLVRNEHWSPIEMVELKFYLRMPLFVVQQLLRHRTANINQESARYSVMADEFYIPGLDFMRPQSTVNKQASGTEYLPEEDAVKAREFIDVSSYNSYQYYEKLLNLGLARERARSVLPVNLYTSLYWKCDLRNFLNFTKLRTDPHAQLEIQAYAKQMLALAYAVAPLTVDAYQRHSIEQVKVPRVLLKEIQAVLGAGRTTMEYGELLEEVEKLLR